MYQSYNDVTTSTPTAILISTVSVEEESNVEAAKVDNFFVSTIHHCFTIHECIITFEKWDKNP